MPRITKTENHHFALNPLLISGLGLALCLGAVPSFAQQEQPGEVSGTIDQQAPEGQPTPDRGPQYQAPQDQPQQNQEPPAQEQAGPDQGPPPNQAVPPAQLTLPAGTVIRVRTNEWLSTDRNLPGDDFSASLDQPIVVDGWVVARRGQAETGRVSMAIKAPRGGGSSQLGIELRQLTFVDGQQPEIQTQLVQNSAGGSSNGRNAAIIGTTTGVGAAIGAVAGGGSGAALGAIVGGAAGIAGAFSTRGRPTVIPPETVLSFRLQAPLTISTEKSQFAFQPVSQVDYDSRGASARPQRYAAPGAAAPPYPPPPPPPAYYGYPYYGYAYPYGFYPAPFGFGFYGGYGFGFGGRFGGRIGGFRR